MTHLNVNKPMQSRLVAAVAPPGTTNFASHLVTLLQQKEKKEKEKGKKEDGWKSTDAARRVRRRPPAKISSDSSSRFCKDAIGYSPNTQTHTLAILDEVL